MTDYKQNVSKWTYKDITTMSHMAKILNTL